MYTDTPAIADTRRPHHGRLSLEVLLHQSDERLVALARSGSERAWDEIMRRYGRQLRSYCSRFVGAGRAEDAVQQTFLQAFLALRDGSEREIALRAWLYRIAHNCAIDVLRKSAPEYEQLDLESDGVAQPPTLFEQREEIRRLVARMRDLPDAQRQALALRELEGRSYEEISAQLGHSGSGVRQLIFRARTTLRNSAAAILPFGLLKGRLYQPGTLECHHVATAVSVPASSGGGIDAVSAATLAVVAVLGGGFAAADGSSRRARPVQAQPAGASPSPMYSPSGAIAPGTAPHGAAPRAAAKRTAGPDGAAPAAALAAPAAAAPVAPTAVSPAVVPPAPDAAVAPGAPATAVDGTTNVAPSGEAPVSGFSGSGTAGTAPATGTTGPSGSTTVAGPAKPADAPPVVPGKTSAPKAVPVKSPPPKITAPKVTAPKVTAPKVTAPKAPALKPAPAAGAPQKSPAPKTGPAKGPAGKGAKPAPLKNQAPARPGVRR